MTTAGPYAPALIAQICREIEELGEEHFAQMAVSPETCAVPNRPRTA
ncbi:hypothetical protein [Streptomyces malaysiensis]|nr:hypothetical protein [Streptomyces malaysiensis]